MPTSPRERFARLFLESSAALGRKMRRFVGSKADADDTVQEAFLRGLESADDVRAPRAFLYTAARNIAVDGYRREQCAKMVALGELALSSVQSSVESVESELLLEERGRVLREAVERLTPQCRSVFALKVFLGYSYKEIAVSLGISVKTVEKHMARGLRETHQYVRLRFEERGNQAPDKEGSERG
jgi:RNA polymerase sigma-70 factor, ECF subfamily